MIKPIKVIDIELSQPLPTIHHLADYSYLKGLVRLHGTPIGFVDVPISGDQCSAQAIGEVILAEHHDSIIHHLVLSSLDDPLPKNGLSLDEIKYYNPLVSDGPWPFVTVAVCTRNRTEHLATCLDALLKLSYPNLEILVIDNAPSDASTEQLIQSEYQLVRYVNEPIPGLDWARNRAIAEANGEIIAYTDDDVTVDPGWIKAIVQPFIEDSSVMAVTGLVVPLELETESQILFETYGGFSRGFKRRWYRIDQSCSHSWEYRGAGQYGTGANMAFRRSLFQLIGPFDPALDVGTVTNGGGDLEMFFRVLKEGYTLVYEPCAIVRHCHRQTYKDLHTQITNNGIGLVAFFVRAAKFYQDETWAFVRFGLWWFYYWLVRRLFISYWQPYDFPRDLIVAELKGAFIGLNRYQKALKIAKSLAESYRVTFPKKLKPPPHLAMSSHKEKLAKAIRLVDLYQPLTAIKDVDTYAHVWILVTVGNRPLGHIVILNAHRPITVAHLRDAIADEFSEELINLEAKESKKLNLRELQEHYITYNDKTEPLLPSLPKDVSVSLVLATFDRPKSLMSCLQSLSTQHTQRPLEIIVVDNHPNSGLTPPVIAKFPNVVLVNEPRQGLSYARNAGILASQGQIIVTTDDDIIAPPHWLETLIAPLAQNDVMAVTGNTLPAELETSAQLFFEMYGGLGRGFQRKVVDGEWFKNFRLHAVPTWELGATANAAFRASIFHQTDIGLMEESLGAGMPTGVAEDTYLFYKILKAGHTIVYEPSAIIWHTHRRTLRALHRQLYSYSKGHVAYHLITYLRDGDWRGLAQICIYLPLVHLWRIIQKLRRKSSYPIQLLIIEITGNLIGPWALMQSWWQVKRKGRSSPYVPVSQRSFPTRGAVRVEPPPAENARTR